MGDFYGYAAELPYEDGDDIKDTLSALTQCLNQVETAANTVHESTETLLTWLKPIDEGETFKGDKKRMAIRVLGARKTKAATGALGEVLLGKDPALAQEALTALTLIVTLKDSTRFLIMQNASLLPCVKSHYGSESHGGQVGCRMVIHHVHQS